MSGFKIFLGPAGTPGFTKGGTFDGIKDVAKIGLSAMEVQFTYGVRMGKELAKKCGQAAKENDVHLSCHAPYYINLCNNEKLAASIRRILLSADRMRVMGGGVVTFHPGFYGSLGEDEALERIRAACKKIVKKLPKEVVLGLETTGKHSQVGTLDEIIDVCKSVRRCVPVVDFAHIYARNGGKIDYGKILKSLDVLGLKRIHSHFSNIEFTHKGERRHLVLDDSPPFKPLAKEIIKQKTNITIICESPILEQDSLRMKKVLEKLGFSFS